MFMWDLLTDKQLLMVFLKYKYNRCWIIIYKNSLFSRYLPNENNDEKS